MLECLSTMHKTKPWVQFSVLHKLSMRHAHVIPAHRTQTRGMRKSRLALAVECIPGHPGQHGTLKTIFGSWYVSFQVTDFAPSRSPKLSLTWVLGAQILQFWDICSRLVTGPPVSRVLLIQDTAGQWNYRQSHRSRIQEGQV